MNISRRLCALAVIALSGCTSSEIRYHTLTGIDDGTAYRGRTIRVRLTELDLPAQIDSAAMRIRRGEHGIVEQPNDRWSAPLSEEIRAVFEDVWRRKRGIENVQTANNVDATLPRVEVHIEKLDASVGGTVVLVASWQVTRTTPAGVRHLACASVAHAPAGATLDAVIRAEQGVVRTLARQLADVLSDPSPGAPECPAPGASPAPAV